MARQAALIMPRMFLRWFVVQQKALPSPELP
jgi:hypothetical protein